MASKPRKPIDLGLDNYNELFMNEQERMENRLPRIYTIPISEIDEFPDHPFQVRMDEDMDQLVESVKERGVITPVTLRKKEDGRYETVSGHRRIKASELAGLETVPAEIKEQTRDEAILLMVDSNLQRSYILPSEKAMAYKMRLEALRRMPGRPTKNAGQENAAPVGPVFSERSNIQVAEEVGESKTQVQRYIRLTELAPELLELVDEGKIAMRPAVELSYLNDIEQKDLIAALDEADATPSHAQAIKLRNFSKEGKLTPEVIESIMQEEKPNQRPKISFKYEELKQYMPSNISYEDTANFVVKALKYYHRYLQRQREQER
jgi:ParB family chromosome partitioning protein